MKFLKWPLVVAAVVGGLLVVWVRMPRSCFYGESGPTALGEATKRALAWVCGTRRPPRRQVALEIRGRKSGQLRELPVVVATVGGELYLVSMLGQEAAWVANARGGVES